MSPRQHAMLLEHAPDGDWVWYCPECGRTVVYHPDLQQLCVDPKGDEQADHSARLQELQ